MTKPIYSELLLNEMRDILARGVQEEGGNNRGEEVEAIIINAVVSHPENYRLYGVDQNGRAQARPWCQATEKAADEGVRIQTGISREVHDTIIPPTLSTRHAIEYYAANDALLAADNRLFGDVYPGMPVYLDRRGGGERMAVGDRNGGNLEYDWINHTGLVDSLGEQDGVSGFYTIEGNAEVTAGEPSIITKRFYAWDDPQIIGFADVNKLAAQTGHYAEGHDIAGRRVERFNTAVEEAAANGLTPEKMREVMGRYDPLADGSIAREGPTVPLTNPHREQKEPDLLADNSDNPQRVLPSNIPKERPEMPSVIELAENQNDSVSMPKVPDITGGVLTR